MGTVRGGSFDIRAPGVQRCSTFDPICSSNISIRASHHPRPMNAIISATCVKDLSSMGARRTKEAPFSSIDAHIMFGSGRFTALNTHPC